MEVTKRPIESWLMVVELFFGIGLSLIGYKTAVYFDNGFGPMDFGSVIKSFLQLNLIFFFAVYSIGIIGAITTKQSDNIPIAVLFSLLFWLISVFLSIALINILGLLSLYISLPGIIVGFNIGIMRKRR